MRIIVWTGFLVMLAVLWGREILAFGEARREGGAARADYKKFRRRTLGLFVLLLLAFMADAGTWVAVVLNLDLRMRIVYYGLCFVLLIWLLIIATRDMRAIGEEYAAEQQRVTIDALKQLERRLKASRDPDDQPIPPLDFSQPPPDGEPETPQSAPPDEPERRG